MELRPVSTIADEFSHAIRHLRDTLAADADPLAYLNITASLLTIVHDTATTLQAQPLDQPIRFFTPLFEFLNQRNAWLRSHQLTLTSSTPTTIELPTTLPPALANDFVALTPQQQYRIVSELTTSTGVLLAEQVLSTWTLNPPDRDTITVNLVAPIVLRHPLRFYAFSHTVQQHIASFTGTPHVPRHHDGIDIDLASASGHLNETLLTSIARALTTHRPEPLDDALTLVTAYRTFLTDTTPLPLPTTEYATFDHRLNAASLLNAMTKTDVYARGYEAYFDTNNQRYFLTIDETTDLADLNTVPEYEEYTSNPVLYILQHHERPSRNDTTRADAMEHELRALQEELRATATAEELLARLQQYATRAADRAPRAATEATVRGILFYYVTKHLGSEEAHIIGMAEAIVDFLLHTAFPPRTH